MSQTDILYLVMGFLLIIPVFLIFDYVWSDIFPQIQADAPASVSDNVTAVDAEWTNISTFWNASFSAIFIIMGLASVILTVFVRSHPVFLVMWLLFNIVIIIVWDTLNDFLGDIVGSDIDTGIMDDAIAFFHSDVPKWIIGFNVLMAIVMLGKQVV